MICPRPTLKLSSIQACSTTQVSRRAQLAQKSGEGEEQTGEGEKQKGRGRGRGRGKGRGRGRGSKKKGEGKGKGKSTAESDSKKDAEQTEGTDEEEGEEERKEERKEEDEEREEEHQEKSDQGEEEEKEKQDDNGEKAVPKENEIAPVEPPKKRKKKQPTEVKTEENPEKETAGTEGLPEKPRKRRNPEASKEDPDAPKESKTKTKKTEKPVAEAKAQPPGAASSPKEHDIETKSSDKEKEEDQEGKGSEQTGRGKKATFAKRVEPSSGIGKLKWKHLKENFVATIKPALVYYSAHEDWDIYCCVLGFHFEHYIPPIPSPFYTTTSTTFTPEFPKVSFLLKLDFAYTFFFDIRDPQDQGIHAASLNNTKQVVVKNNSQRYKLKDVSLCLYDPNVVIHFASGTTHHWKYFSPFWSFFLSEHHRLQKLLQLILCILQKVIASYGVSELLCHAFIVTEPYLI